MLLGYSGQIFTGIAPQRPVGTAGAPLPGLGLDPLELAGYVIDRGRGQRFHKFAVSRVWGNWRS